MLLLPVQKRLLKAAKRDCLSTLFWQLKYKLIRTLVLGVSMKIRPLQDRILVKRVETEEKTAGGIIIPDNAKEKPMEGQVIAVGNGKKLDDGSLSKPDLSVGDSILFSKYAGSEVKIDGVEHLIMREDDILGVLEK